MSASPPRVVVAGHICLDLIPTLRAQRAGLADLLVPGQLVEAGPAVLSTGGPVSNTGLALHRLGVPVRLMGKIGDDLFGDAIRRIVGSYDARLAAGMLVEPGARTSYTIVISPPGVDRVFLHCPGANDTFGADDIPYDELAGVRVFHFGYPPLMRRMYADSGRDLETMFRRAKQRGVVTSLDMAMPDPASDAGRTDWQAILARVLPHIDVFLPSLDEILFMLRSGRGSGSQPVGRFNGALLADVSEELLRMGAAVVGLKLGDQGLYVRTTAERAKLAPLEKEVPLETWLGRELLTPCFEVNVVGTTGCGDATIAGFLAGMLHGLSLENALTAAVGVGACNVEQPDALSGVPTWEAVQARIRAGWKKRAMALDWPDWSWDATRTLTVGSNDAAPRTR